MLAFLIFVVGPPHRRSCSQWKVSGFVVGPHRRALPQWKGHARRITGFPPLLDDGGLSYSPVDAMSPFGLLLGVGVGGVLGLLGGGGSILALPCFLYVFQEPADSAVAESLAVVAIGAATGFAYKARGSGSTGATTSSSLVDFGVAVPFAGVAASSSFATARFLAGHSVPEGVRLGLFSIFAVASAVSMWDSTKARVSADVATAGGEDGPSGGSKEGEEEEKRLPAPSRLAALAAGVGALTSLIGAGGGFVVVPALTTAGGVPVKRAVASALLVVATNAAAAFISFATATTSVTTMDLIHYRTVLPFAAAAAAGAVAGSELSDRIDGRIVKQVFAISVLLLAAGELGSALLDVLS